MKKQNNIFTYIAKITYSVTLAASLYACADEEIIKKSSVEEGIPAEISMKFASPEMDKMSTRGLNDNQELQVNNLYILIFNGDGTVKKTGSGLYENTTSIREITLSTTSGESLIYGIANAKTNQQDQVHLIEDLENVKNLNDLNNLIATTTLVNGLIEVDRTSPDLLMSGAYIDPSYTGRPSGYCEIQPGDSKLTGGKLRLIHLDSHIRFNIHTGEKVTTIEPKEWKVCNVPTRSYVIGRSDKTNCSQNAYANSGVYNNQTIHAEKDSKNPNKDMHTFSFYQMENFNYGKDGLTSAKDREKEEKNADGTNTGVFKYVDGHPTYVQFKAYLELNVWDKETNQEIQRVADINITILLGGKDPNTEYDFKNFNTWRNQKYTYDVTINDVNDIVIEVTDDDETRPGIEGDVIDAKDKVRILDAHYNCFNILLTPEQVEKMHILVHTPFDDVKYNSETDQNLSRPSEGTNRDYKWIQFKYLGERQKIEQLTINFMPLATYTPNGLLDIYSLRADVKSKGSGEHYYTVFIDEYFYNDVPNKEQWTSPYWKHFVNQDDRYVMLIYTPQESDDKESTYSEPRYFIKQKSIQTYYSATTLNNDNAALGMEHMNETPSPVWSGQSGVVLDNGYRNCQDAIGKKSDWNDFLAEELSYITGFQYHVLKIQEAELNTFNLSTDEINKMCLSRNRDKNGDGKIDENEMEWYVPTYQQISGMYLGATSLSSPLFTPPSDGSKVIFDDPNYHFMTSDGDKIWAQEGCSNKGIEKGANQMRCVRNLGISAEDSYRKAPSQPYNVNFKDGVHFVFDMSRIADSNIRTKKANTLGAHENFKDTKNKPFKKFELAKKFSETKFEGGVHTWGKYHIFTDGKDDCQDYYEGLENDATRGKGKWRTPNQRELLIIYNLLGIEEMRYTDPITGTIYGMYSCTYWEYDTWGDQWTDNENNTHNVNSYRIFGAHTTINKMFLDNVKENGVHYSEEGTILRCVRDID